MARGVLSICLLGALPAAAQTPPPDFNDAFFANVPGPTALTFTPDGRVLITTQGGQLRVYDQAGTLLHTAITLPSLCTQSERGLLGIAVDPSFATNNFIYLYYTDTTGPANTSGNCKNRVSRFTLPDTNIIDPASRLPLIENIHSTAGNHNGGDLHFGNDGNLYVSAGDGGCDYAGDSGCAGQNDASRDQHVLIGKILRITPTGGIPATNPFQGPGTARCNVTGSTTFPMKCQETFAWGLRNPFRFAFDPNDASVTNQRFYINDVGQGEWEEIDRGQSGANYGWNCREGAHVNNSATTCPSPPAGMVEPIFDYNHDTGCGSITGAAFIPRGLWPAPYDYDGAYLFADYNCGRIFRLGPNGSGGLTWFSFVGDLGGSSAVAMTFGPWGPTQGLYYTTYAGGGEVRRIRFTGLQNHSPVADLAAGPLAGPAPLDVAFDGSGSQDSDGDALTYVWDFGEGDPPTETATPTIGHVYSTIGSFTATLRVRDTKDAVSDPESVLVNVANSPPVPVITSPAPDGLFSVGQTLTLSGSATDPQDGVLPPASLTWEVLKHHNAHTHPFLLPTPGNDIPITAPAPEDLDATATTYLEIRLTATDANNLSRTIVRNVFPHTVNVSFETVPTGLKLNVNGVAFRAPRTFLSWEGYDLNLIAANQLDAGGHGQSFASWSDAGAASHTLTTPAAPATYTASFDLTPALSISNATVTEGNAGPTQAVFTVSLSDPSPGTVSVDYATAAGTAAAGSDYTTTAGTLTFAPGALTQTLAVSVLGDTALEGTESFFVQLSGLSGAMLGVGRGEGFILDDDAGTRLEFSAAAYSAGEGAGSALITVSRLGSTTGTATVDYATLDGTATAGSDYTSVTGTLTFAPGIKSRTFRVPITNDTLDENDETVLLRLLNPGPSAALGVREAALLTLRDNDTAGRLRFAAAGYKANEAGALATISVRREGGAASGVTVEYATTGGTAAPGLDYTPTSGLLSFGAGVMMRTFTVELLDDGLTEGNETVGLSLGSPSGGATLGTPASAVLTIQEGNPVLQFSAPNYMAGEAAGRAVISVTRSGPTASGVSVSYATSDGTAVHDVHYTSTSGLLSFGPGVTMRTFAVPLINGTTHEDAPTVLLSLSGASAGASLGPQNTAVLTLRDDDPAGTLRFSLAGYSVRETTPTVTITVRRVGGNASDVSVAYATSNGTAQAGVNYTSTAGTLSFGRGILSRTFTVPILDDGAPNGDLTVNLALSAPGGGAVLGTPSTAVLTIVTPDPLVEFGAPTYKVGAAGPSAVISVKRSGPLTGTVTATYATSDGTATAGVDYTATAGTLTFGPGIALRTFAVAVTNDAMLEGNETVNLALTGAGGGAALGPRDTATLTITSDDASVLFGSATYTVGELARQALITVRRMGLMSAPVSVSYATSNGSAEAGIDYTPANGTLSFGPGVGLRSFVVPLLADSGHEDRETIQLDLSAPTGALLGTPATAVLTIRDNDPAGSLQFSVTDYSVSETGPLATITVLRTGGTASGVTVDYATLDGSAVAGTDYRSSSGTLVFGEGQTSATFTVEVMDDLAPGSNKTVNLALSNPQGGSALGSRAAATLWIVENR